jgi:GT2 family glycosyltransferase
MATSREAIAIAGPFDLRLGPGASGYFEDTVFGWTVERAGLKILYLPNVAVEHNFDPDRLKISAFMAAARRMAMSRALVDRDSDPERPQPPISALLAQAPGLGARSLTQLARYVFLRQPDPGFMSRYYRLKLWQARRQLARTR